MLRIKDYTTKVGSGVTPRGGAETYLDEGIPLFRSQNVTNDGFLMDDIAFISEEVDESMKGTRVKPGDVLLNITGASIGRCFYTSDDFERGNVNQHVCIIRPKKNKVKPDYLHYCIISDKGQQQIDLTQTGANREGLAVEDIRGFMFDIPSLPVQQRIVDYLDEKLTKIDGRIDVLEKQQDAYVRLKKSIIHQAVTRGLKPNVSLKDSGIEWIGMIPEHWEVKRIKDLCSFVSRGSTPDYVDESDFPVMNQAVFSSGCINHEVVRYSSYMKPESKIEKGDLLIASTGGGILGKLYFFNIEDEQFYADTHVTIVRSPKKTFCVKFLYYLLSIGYNMINTCMAKGSTNQTELQRDKLIAYEIAIPSIEEQTRIIDYLDEKCTKIDAAIENISKQIDALKRLKRALINEVITGQRAV
jgi:type I restriction enzyme S subunit